MAPVALATPATGSPKGLNNVDIIRRSSPWHDIAHSLSEAPSPTPSLSARPSAFPLSSPPSEIDTPPGSSVTPPLSSSRALRDWERLLAHPFSDAKRHQLVHPPSDVLGYRSSNASLSSAGAPKLAAERDKDGHIEYKLKLIDPTPERFERLVTQMMWRLKQGRNEAIYEIGLADDGTVIGLTRPEMDASLRTLELMASEVGATVIVLREIVLTGSASNLPPSGSPAFSAAGTSISYSDPSLSSGFFKQDAGWIIHRPDLDEYGQPRKGTRGLGGGEKYKSKRHRARERWLAEKGEEMNKEKQVIFSCEDLQEDFECINSTSPQPNEAPRRRRRSSISTPDEDVLPFHLDLDDMPPSQSTSPSVRFKSRASTPSPRASEEDLKARNKKSQSKAVKSAAKREQRRLDLLRGDGTNPIWAELSEGFPPSTLSTPGTHHATVRPALSPHSAIHRIPPLPHQPARPSSLSLATPSESPDEAFLTDLLHLPLDNLSLSFADVRTVTDPVSASDFPSFVSTPSSTSTDTESTHHLDPDRHETSLASSDGRMGSGSLYLPPPPGEEMICVEALVVRKNMEDTWCGEDDLWGLGGDDDGWGFGEED